MKNYLATYILSIVTCTAIAADPPISLTDMRAFTAEFDYFLQQENGDLTPAGIWTDSVEFTGTHIIRTVSRTPLGGETDLVRTVAADRATLTPVHIDQRFGPGLQSIYKSSFDQDELTQVLITDRRSPPRVSKLPLPGDVMEVNLQGILAAALPFTSQARIELDGYKAGVAPDRVSVAYFVQGEHDVDLNGEVIRAWRVHEPGSDWTYWVRKEPPYLVKVSHPAPDGKRLVSVLAGFKVTDALGQAVTPANVSTMAAGAR